MKKNFTLRLLLYVLLISSATINAQETVFSDDFSFQSNWTQSYSGGTVTFSNNVMTLTANTAGTTTVGRKATLPYTLFLADSVEVQFDFNSSLLGFQAILGTTPSRIQVAKDNGINLRMSGEATSATTNGAKFIATTPNAWHTMTIKYKKTATSTTATFIVDDGAGVLTQVIDLTLQASGYNFVLNAIDFRAINGEVLQVKNFKIIGTKVVSTAPVLYTDNFTFKNNWVEHFPLNASVEFNADPENIANNIMKVSHTSATPALTDSLVSAMPVFNFTGTDYTISYKFRTKLNRSNIAFGVSPKRLFVNSEYTDAIPTKMRLCGEATTLAYGAKTFLSATSNVWHSVSVKYNIADKTATLVIDPNLPSGATVTVDLKTQPTPYELILNAMTIKASNADVFEVKDLKINGVGTASASTPAGLTAVNVVQQTNKLKNVRFVNGVMCFNIDNQNSTSSKLYLHNVLGNIVFEQNLNNGLTAYSIPAAGLSKGVYILTLQMDGEKYSQKLILQ